MEISKVLENPDALSSFVDYCISKIDCSKFESIVAVEGRDFILGSVLALKLDKSFVMYRRSKKLPTGDGVSKIETDDGLMAIHSDAFYPETKSVLLIASDLKGEEHSKSATKLLIEKFNLAVVPFQSFNLLEGFFLDQKIENDSMFQPNLELSLEEIGKEIRVIMDFPIEGIKFLDISTILKSPKLFRNVMHHLAHQYKARGIDGVILIESRGFLFAPLAYLLRIPILTVHKPGKLVGEILMQDIVLEYGSDKIEMVKPQVQLKKSVIFDDLVATGGTMLGTLELGKKSGCSVEAFGCFLELKALNGREKLKEQGDIELLTLLDV